MALNNFSWVIPGKLAGLAMPGASRTAPGSHVLSDLKDLHEQGVRCLVSLQRMPDTFGGLCEQAGLEWMHFPILDFEVPPDTWAFSRLVDDVIRRMNDNAPVAVHCRAGVGRTGMLLSCVVGRLFGINGDKAIHVVRKARNALDTTKQEEFVRDFCSTAAT